MGCGASSAADVALLDDAGQPFGSAFGWREQIWADTYAPGRVEIGRTAEIMRTYCRWLPCNFVKDPTDAQLLKLRATLAHQWNGKQRPANLRVGGRARSYVADAGFAVRNTKDIMDRFDPDDATLALAGYEGTTQLMHAGGLSPRDSWAEQNALGLLPGSTLEDKAQPHEPPPPTAIVCAPRFTVLCPPANKIFKPAYGAMPSNVVAITVVTSRHNPHHNLNPGDIAERLLVAFRTTSSAA